jgi:hypothetical protein
MERRMFIVMMILFSLLSTPVEAAKNPKVVLETSMGNITLELYPTRPLQQ